MKVLAFPLVALTPRSRIVGPSLCPNSVAPARAACEEARRIATEGGGFEDTAAAAAATAADAIAADLTEAELGV